MDLSFYELTKINPWKHFPVPPLILNFGSKTKRLNQVTL